MQIFSSFPQSQVRTFLGFLLQKKKTPKEKRFRFSGYREQMIMNSYVVSFERRRITLILNLTNLPLNCRLTDRLESHCHLQPFAQSPIQSQFLHFSISSS